MNYLKNIWQYIIFALIPIVVLWLCFRGNINGYLINWDSSVILDSRIYLERTLNIFSNFRFPGVINPQIAGHFFYALINFIIDKATGSIISPQIVLFALLLFFSSFNFYKLSNLLLKDCDNPNKRIITALSALFYSYAIYCFVSNWAIFNLSIFSYSFLPLLLYYFILVFSNKKYLIHFSLIIFLISPGVSNIAYLPIIILILLIYYLIFINRSKKTILTFAAIISVLIIELLPIIIPQILLVKDFIKSASIGGIFESFSQNNSNSNLLNLLNGTFFQYTHISKYINFNNILMKILFLIPGLILIVATFNKKNNKRQFYWLVAAYIFTCILILGANFPFSHISKFLFDNIGFFGMYRDSIQKLTPLYMIIFSTLIMYSILNLNKKIYINLFAICVVSNCIIFGYLFYNFNDRVYSNFDNYKQISQIINNDKSTFSVLSLPVTDSPLTRTKIDKKDYYGFNIFQLLTNAPIASNKYGEPFIDGLNNHFEDILSQGYFENIYNIKYVIFDKNASFLNQDQKYRAKILETLNNGMLFERVLENNDAALYQYKNFDEVFKISGSYQKKDNIKYYIFLKKVSVTDKIIFKRRFSNNWKVLSEDNAQIDIFHSEFAGYGNECTFDKNILEKYGTINGDNTYNINLILVFSPQIFEIILMRVVYGSVFIIVFLYYVCVFLKRPIK